MAARGIIKKPLITERSMQLVKKNQFTFIVAMGTTKEMIKNAIQSAFKVDVVAVDTAIQKGKTKRVGKKREMKDLSAIKKAIVTVKEGQKIDIFDLGV